MDPIVLKRSKYKRLRNSGKAYVSGRSCQVVAEKRLLDVTEHKCRFDCVSKFAEHDRRLIFDSFWSLADFDDQNALIAGCVRQSGIRRRRSANLSVESRTRRYSRRYFLTNPSKNDLTPLEVCKSFFLRTLAVSNGRVDRLLQKQCRNDSVVPKDRRGRTDGSRSNAYDETSLDFARTCLDDHRKSGKTVSVYAAYVTECEKSCRTPIKRWKFRELQKQQSITTAHKTPI